MIRLRLGSPRTAALLLGLVLAARADAESGAPPDTSAWKCRLCTFDYGFGGYGEAGIIGLDEGSYRFGKYSGLYHSGAYPLLNGELRYRDPNGDYLDLQGKDLGLSSRAVTLDAGRQGLLEFSGLFQDIPYNQYGDATTPFLGVGGSHLELPASWVPGGTTAQMPGLPDALRAIGIRQPREIYGLGLRFTPSGTPWSLDVKFRHDRQSGTQISGANFLTTSSLLPAPVDYDTDQVDAGAQIVHARWQLRLAYYGSFFHNADGALSWSNPFTPYGAGADLGRMSTAPDNSFNQLSLSGGWQILPSTRLMASVAYGIGVQNEDFIPSTVNASLQAAPLPRSSLDGRLDTGNYTVRLTSTPIKRLSLVAEFVQDRRDNRTPQAGYQQVGTDVYLGATRTNLPYSFDKTSLRLIAAYRVARLFKLEGGGQTERKNFSFQEIARSYTTSEWGEVRTTFATDYGFSAKYERSHRTVGDYLAVPTIFPVENPLLRKYDLADRIRERALGSAFYTPVQSVSLGLSLEHDQDNYDRSPVGLTSAKNYSINLTGNWTPSRNGSLYVFLTRQLISADQAGSQSGSFPDWNGHTSERVNSAGLGGQWKNVLPRLDLGADGNFSYTTEAIRVSLATLDTAPYPDNTVHDLGIRFFSRYHLSPRSSLRFDYWHERYLTSDWALDGVAPTTIANVLTLGVISPDYDVNLFALSYRYEF
jgi:MtrB/PioB family decaheme-associated outer membrane protein